MARQFTIGGNEQFFIGEDKTITAEVLDTSGTPVDVSGFTIALDVRTSDTSGSSLLSKTGAISGTYSATRTANTQRVTFTIADTDIGSGTFDASVTYRWSIKRTDAGEETIYGRGNFILQRATQT